MRRVLFFGGLALAVFSCTSGGSNTDTSASDTSTTLSTDGTTTGAGAGFTDTTTMTMGGDTGVGRTTVTGQDTAATGGGAGRKSMMQDSL